MPWSATVQRCRMSWTARRRVAVSSVTNVCSEITCRRRMRHPRRRGRWVAGRSPGAGARSRAAEASPASAPCVDSRRSRSPTASTVRASRSGCRSVAGSAAMHVVDGGQPDAGQRRTGTHRRSRSSRALAPEGARSRSATMRADRQHLACRDHSPTSWTSDRPILRRNFCGPRPNFLIQRQTAARCLPSSRDTSATLPS